MAYYQTSIQIGESKAERVFVGEPEDRCFVCNRNLDGEQCLRFDQDNYLICLDQPTCDAYASGTIGEMIYG